MSELKWPFLPGRNISIDRAEGIYLYTDNGQEIIDAAGGAIVACIGHGNDRVVEAIAKATKQTSYIVPPWITPSRQAMLDALADWLPPSLTRVHCTSGGSESNEAAIKIALHYQQAIGETSRTQVIGRSISYHGTTLATASISGHPSRKIGLEASLPNFLEVETPYTLRCPVSANQGDYYVDLLAHLIEAEGAENVAALLSEPITGSSGGALVPPDDYWPKVRKLCDDNGILLIMDEVMTGYGRTGQDFGFQHWPIEPDILVGGKGLAGGYAPLGGVFAREAIGEAIEQAGFQVMFNTFGAHPAACAAAAEVLNIMREDNLVQQAATRGDYLSNRLRDLFSNHPHVAETRGKGLLQAIEVVADRETLEQFPKDAQISSKIVVKGLQKGVFFYGGGTGVVRDIVCMGPPLTIDEPALDRIAETLLECVDEAIAEA
ncbi:MAG: aminotransferase class III-fold pyridoxal phosphate-dependent enzyme [Pseudomonadales bacterium]|nr:aminotransferase class III-fold pyridoxal phosphate-dependent enzyme [Pseudomonadales bacterium]